MKYIIYIFLGYVVEECVEKRFLARRVGRSFSWDWSSFGEECVVGGILPGKDVLRKSRL